MPFRNTYLLLSFHLMMNTFRIGIAYDRTEEYAEVEGPADRFAEFEPESTIMAMEAAIRRCGHKPVRLGGPYTLLASRPKVDLIWNIAEGYGSRNREGWVPVLCEMYGIPFLGSDAFTLTWSLDKASTKQLARSLDIPTSDWQVVALDLGANSDSAANSEAKANSAVESWASARAYPAADSETVATSESEKGRTSRIPSLPWPLFAKPRYEGTAKGITEGSILRSEEDYRREVERLHRSYRQDVLLERFLPGAEYTVAVTGTPLRAHPVMERGVDTATGIGYHVMDGLGKAADYRLQNGLNDELESAMKGWSLQLCEAMGVRDFARLDFKCDADGAPYFLEINPLPTFAVDNTFAILAELEGVPYEDFLSTVLNEAIGRVMGS